VQHALGVDPDLVEHATGNPVMAAVQARLRLSNSGSRPCPVVPSAGAAGFEADEGHDVVGAAGEVGPYSEPGQASLGR